MQINEQFLFFTLIILIAVAVLLPVIAFIFEFAFTTRLFIPIVYIILMYTVFSSWRQANEKLYGTGLALIIIVSVLSWVPELRKMLKERSMTNSGEIYRQWQLDKAKEKGVDLENSTFDKKDNLVDKDTGEKLIEFDEDINKY